MGLFGGPRGWVQEGRIQHTVLKCRGDAYRWYYKSLFKGTKFLIRFISLRLTACMSLETSILPYHEISVQHSGTLAVRKKYKLIGHYHYIAFHTLSISAGSGDCLPDNFSISRGCSVMRSWSLSRLSLMLLISIGSNSLYTPGPFAEHRWPRTSPVAANQ